MANRLRERMSEVGVNEERLAAYVGCTQQAINKILNGQTANSRFLPRIAHQLGVDLDWLLGLQDEMVRDGAAAPLSPDQLELLSIFDLLDDVGRLAWLEVGRRMAGKPDSSGRLHNDQHAFRNKDGELKRGR